MNKGNIGESEFFSEHLLTEVDLSERVLVRRGSHSCFYRVYWKEKHIWIGLKEEEFTDPLSTLRMMKTIQELKSPFILHHYGSFLMGNKTIVVLSELMDLTLSDLMHRHSPLKESQTRAVAFLTLHALVDLHDRLSMVHRDVSPSNIFLRKTGELKIGDLSGVVGVNESVDHFASTIFYTPVEVLKDYQKASNTSSNIWALGVILYQCANGHHPFVTKCNDDFWRFLSVMEMTMEEKQIPKKLTQFSEEFNDLICNMLRWDPSFRPNAQSLLNHTWFSNFNLDAAQHEIKLMFT